MALWKKLFGSQSSLPSNEMQGPAQWERRGESLQETIAARSAKLSRPNRNLRDAVSRGSVWFRSHCETYAEFPIVYSRLFVPLSAFTAG